MYYIDSVVTECDSDKLFNFRIDCSVYSNSIQVKWNQTEEYNSLMQLIIQANDIIKSINLFDSCISSILNVSIREFYKLYLDDKVFVAFRENKSAFFVCCPNSCLDFWDCLEYHKTAQSDINLASHPFAFSDKVLGNDRVLNSANFGYIDICYVLKLYILGWDFPMKYDDNYVTIYLTNGDVILYKIIEPLKFKSLVAKLLLLG